MQDINVVHCLFEQSGNTKNVLKEFGIKAFDYDILNMFGETDYQIDLFGEIEKGYGGGLSIFDNIKEDDLIIAFFPCVRFSDQSLLQYKCEASQLIKKKPLEKLELSIKHHKELQKLFTLINQLVGIALKKNLKLIIENPYSPQHYLYRYWWLKPKVIDLNRWQHGDYYEKPTQYWFINCDPKNNKVKPPERQVIKRIKDENTVERSMIHPNYIRWWIKSYILDGKSIKENEKEINLFDFL